VRITKFLYCCSFCSIILVQPFSSQTLSPAARPNIYAVDLSEADTGVESDIAIDQQGCLHISYYDATNGNLKYARQLKGDLVFDSKTANAKKYGEWVIFTVDSVGTVGRFSSIKVDSMSRPCISYYDVKNKALKFARFDGQKWLIQYVDAGNVGIHNSLALDSGGRPYISYYDAKKGALKCARYDNFAWHVEEVDREKAGELGLYTSIAIGTDGLERISYYDNKNGKLKFARNTGNYWKIEDVDARINSKTGSFSSVVLGNNDTPHIAYYDTTDANLRYAVKKGFSWEKRVVDSSKNVGEFASIKLDNSGNPWIAYYDAGSQKLKLAQFDGGVWSLSSPVSSIDQFGMSCSLTIDKANNWHISCRDLKSRKLCYLSNQNRAHARKNKWFWIFR